MCPRCNRAYLQVEIDALRAEVERVTALHGELLSKAQRGELELGAISAEHAAEIEAERARQAAAHERRVEHLTQVAARRLGKRELSLGWQTWLEMWEITSRQMRQMRAVQARMRQPLVAASFLEWRRGWEAYEEAGHLGQSAPPQQRSNAAPALGARLAPLGGSAHPRGRGRPTGRPATALGARAQARRLYQSPTISHIRRLLARTSGGAHAAHGQDHQPAARRERRCHLDSRD